MTSKTRPVLTEGTWRSRAPEATWERMRPLLRRYDITRVADVTGLDDIGLPVFQAVRPMSRTLSVSQGKGMTPLLAKLSAVFEAVELWHAERPNLPITETSLAAAATYPPSCFQLRVPDELARTVQLKWVQGVGLCSKRSHLIPFDLVRLSHTDEEDGEPAMFKTSSTGLASGNTADEATLHALFEILERDVLSDLTEVGTDDRIIVDLNHLTEPTIVELVDRLRRAGVDLELSMVPNRYGVPTATAHIWSAQFPETCAGSGAHLDPVIAATRAITEAIQTRLTCISGMRDDLPSVVTAFDGYRTPPTFEQHGASWGAAVGAFAPAPSPDVASAVDAVAGVLGEHTGWEPVVVDLSTRPEDFSVVRVVAPGARFAARGHVPR
ncbi:hypothetical protein NS263_07975 [Curtobacterium oceanosedimentum]|uniref:YcaO domain-containing protein n=1 Tax=Curtobacterium oceanosedimentum TaxID=465820 RepID=A0ABR5S6M2_9MICO|nr:YcaO-like family protein [Curtobacterium oceanosedimentum]KTR40392.1 hypothetical protein NS263_07975 [Curtobacterium oceanosedimentum]